MSFKFEKLIIWQKSMDLAEEVHEVSIKFPKEEQYNLTNQIRRAADSIALNIAEGSIGQTNPEQGRFIGYALRSLAEVVTCLYKARRRKYIDDLDFKSFYSECFNLMNMIVGFRNSINKNN